jgi:hypothetical protein
MGKSPKSNEEQLTTILNAWKNLAADKTFGGMTVTQFEAAIEPSMTVRAQLVENDNERTHLLNTREANDEVSLGKAELVVNGVIGDPNYGRDSSLYEAMGYTRKSERQSGLTRKKGSAPPSPPKT